MPSPSQTFSLAEVIRGALDARMSGVHVALPGKVTSYDATQQRVSVQPLIKRGYFDEEGERLVENLPVVPDVPVMFPGAGAYSITFPILSGTVGLLVFCDGSMDRWLADGDLVDPGDDRVHALTDAVFIPGLRSFNRNGGQAAPIKNGTGTGAPPTNALVVNGADIRLGDKDASSTDNGVVRKSDLQKIYNALATAVTGAGYGADVQTKLTAAFPSGLTASTTVKVK